MARTHEEFNPAEFGKKTIICTAVVGIVAAIAIIAGIFITKSDVFDNSGNLKGDTSIIFNPVSYMEKCEELGHAELKKNYDDYLGKDVRLYGKVIDIIEPKIGKTHKILIRSSWVEKDAPKETSDMEKMLLCLGSYEGDPDEKKISVGDFVWFYGVIEDKVTYTTEAGTKLTVSGQEVKVLQRDDEYLESTLEDD